MTAEVLKFLGIHPVGPENSLCALFYWEEADRHVPVWVSPIDGARVLQVLERHYNARPSTYELLIAFADQLDGIEHICVSEYHKGAFMVDVVDGTGEEHDARICDALVLADHYGVPIRFEKEMLEEVAVYISDEDLKEYYGLEREAKSPETFPEKRSRDFQEMAARQKAQEDDDFEQLMRDSGISEEDLLGGDSPEDED
ncbi:bifunctional nuclease domain-containing protein [Corynebacterium hiratae]|uniref:Bifunctional nuclease family protein n=1 Tax=Corynebacterium hiratae TaxID=3139423 RepID=A0A553G0W2_9CORY|nr:bifunctional nuclease domain-containing protein [Corynebacterium aurimucosum]TRX63130.1 bifunctional nuclease family protein [Corynebacterium aurimucosum]